MENFAEFQRKALAAGMEYSKRVRPLIDHRLASEDEATFEKYLGLKNGHVKTKNQLKSYLSHRYDLMCQGVESSFRSLSIASYHCSRICDIDYRLQQALKDFPIDPNTVMAGGNTTILDAEYQALIMSCRRTLDQLVMGISETFKNKKNSYREFGEYLTGQAKKQPDMAEPLLAAYFAHRANVEGWLFADGEHTSIRDLIAHRKSVSVGTLNVHHAGSRFIGIEGHKVPANATLSDIATQLMGSTQSSYDALLSTFVDVLELRLNQD